MVALWDELAKRANRTLTAAQHAQLAKYLDLLLAANQTMNLTRIVDRSAAEVQHVGDALTLLPYLPKKEASDWSGIRIVDVGSGGGVPGIPLAIAVHGATVMLIEATQKKAAFLNATIEALGLKNCSVSSWRAEQVGRSNSRETFDVAVARAVGGLGVLVEWCLPLVRKGGKLLAMKGARVAEELPAAQRAIQKLNGGEAIVHKVELPGAEHHVIVEVPKVGTTHAKYPRDPSVAKGRSV